MLLEVGEEFFYDYDCFGIVLMFVVKDVIVNWDKDFFDIFEMVVVCKIY